jgi:hypothetical protein
MRMLKRPRRADRKLNQQECEVDAELAAEMAGDAAAIAVEWARSAGVVEAIADELGSS